MKEGDNETMVAEAKSIFLALNEVFKILKEEAGSTDVKDAKEKQEE